MGEQPPVSNLIYDWNTAGNGYPHRGRTVEFDDETLRDGLQSPSVRDPDIDTKIRLLHLMEQLGIHTLDVGLPGAGPRAVADITALCREIVNGKLKIRPNCAVRTVISDIEPLVDISQKAGIAIEACTFIGSSPIRQFAEDWLQLTRDAVSFAASHGLPGMYVTEDTCRATPETIKRLFLAAIEAGATRVCVCDTVGHITPRGVRNCAFPLCRSQAHAASSLARSKCCTCARTKWFAMSGMIFAKTPFATTATFSIPR